MSKEYYDWIVKYDLPDNDESRFLYEMRDDMGWWFDEYLTAKEEGVISEKHIRAIENL